MKLFVVSDIHGFFDIFIEALHEAGFVENNPDHLLICCGDYTDRGEQPFEVIEYLKTLQNVVLVRGNHEDLVMECLDRRRALEHDIHNGTVDTINKLSISLGVSSSKSSTIDGVKEYLTSFYACMRDYFETKHYIFVHGWIPLNVFSDLPAWYTKGRTYEYNPDWRDSTTDEWNAARWLNGIDMAHKGFVEPGKTIVCGHWHCSYGHYIDDKDFKIGEFDKTAIWEPYRSEGIIAIDRCTAYTQQCNILTLEDDVLTRNT